MMGTAMEKPMYTVEDAVTTLRRLSSLCSLLVEFENNPMGDTIALCEVASTMALIRDSLDDQIEALDGIQWSSGGR